MSALAMPRLWAGIRLRWRKRPPWWKWYVVLLLLTAANLAWCLSDVLAGRKVVMHVALVVTNAIWVGQYWRGLQHTDPDTRPAPDAAGVIVAMFCWMFAVVAWAIGAP